LGHEWTHHVHGHVTQAGCGANLPNEILATHCNGNLELQVQEIVADGYSLYYVLTNFIDGPARSMLALLKAEAERASSQDRALFSICIVAVAAYLFVSAAPDLAEVDPYRLTHPPQAVRMRFIAFEASSWCSHNRPELDVWMSTQFMTLMSAVAEATLDKTGVQLWVDQRAFLRSAEGVKYFDALGERLKAYKRSYGTAEDSI
jgi:hypothetical protein